MENKILKVGMGGGCHWCTEAIFQSIKGVVDVKQGWISSTEPYNTFSEAVLIEFDESVVKVEDLIEIHTHSHSSTTVHRLSEKYRSAVYTFSDLQAKQASAWLKMEAEKTGKTFVTKVLPFVEFRQNKEEYLNYYQTDKERPFCKTYIEPKIDKLSKIFKNKVRDSDF